MNNNIIVLTGAGVSAESGLKTFRDNDGLWENHPIEDVATPEAFARDPKLVQRFYNLRRQQLLGDNVHPNAAHIALAELEKNHQGNFLLVTQNVDNLHEQAGSQNVIHMHGELTKSRCQKTQKVHKQFDDITSSSLCPCCHEENQLRPHIVWFGEMPLEMDSIYNQLEKCDMFISIGTSGHVYPAAGFVEVANQYGAQTVELNLEPSLRVSEFKHAYFGNASELVSKFINEEMSKLLSY